MILFPSDEWAKAVMETLNESEEYAQAAKNWEGDFYYIVTPEGALREKVYIYFDFWHGKCREAYVVEDVNNHKGPAFRMTASLNTWHALFEGRLDFLKATLTRKLKVKGNMLKMMKEKKVADAMGKVINSIEIKIPE